jgi:6-phosphofructokinase 1
LHRFFHDSDQKLGFTHALRTSTGSHERISVIEVSERYCGETSLVSAYLAGVELAIISEVPFDPKRQSDLIMQDKAANPKNYVMITISEGVRWVKGEMFLSGRQMPMGIENWEKSESRPVFFSKNLQERMSSINGSLI